MNVVIPVAGLGTRMLPATKAFRTELDKLFAAVDPDPVNNSV